MQNDKQPKDDARNKTFQLLDEAEKKRALLRFEHALDELAGNNPRILRNREFTDSLPQFLYDQFLRGNSEKAKIYLDILFEFLEEERHDEAIIDILSEISYLSLKGYNIRLMQYLCSQISHVLGKERQGSLVATGFYDFLIKSCGTFVRGSLWDDFDNLITALWKCRSTTFKSADGHVVTMASLLPRIASKDVIEKIVQLYCSGDEARKKQAAKNTRYLGDNAMNYLLNRLIFSHTKKERFLLLELLVGFGEDIIKPLHIFMEEDLPWYAVRNLIGLIGEIGKPEYYPMIEGYLIHPDLRVQQQVVACIVKLGGTDADKRLVQALSVVDDEAKLKLIRQMSAYSSEEIARGLVGLLYHREKFTKDMKNDLTYSICITLRSYPYAFVVRALQELLDESPKTEKERTRTAIAESIGRLNPIVRHRNKEEKTDSELLSFDFDPETKEVVSAGLDGFMEEIDSMVRTGKVEKATPIMYSKIMEMVRVRDFPAAEMLRDKLLEINPDALQDVIRAAEIIEEEKNSPGSGVQVDIWEELFSKLDGGEHRHLLGAMRNEQYKRDETIVSAGDIDPCIYFVSSGAVRLSCMSGHHETFLKRLKPGDVTGVGPFFSASVWTVNLTALQDTRLQVLRRDLYGRGLQKYPSLDEKIHRFCKARESIPELVRMSGRDRRDSARFAVKITLENVLLDIYGDSGGKRVFHGEMIDISRGGLAFSIRLASKENAHLLLGRQIMSEIRLREGNVMKCLGLIVGVNYRYAAANEYSVHVKFYSEIEQYQVTEVLNLVL